MNADAKNDQHEHPRRASSTWEIEHKWQLHKGLKDV